MINIVWHGILSFFKSQSFIGFATLLAGMGVYIAYKLQKKDDKKNYALTILSEIKSAEKAIDKVKDNVDRGNFEYIPILPETNWDKYKYLFVKDFDPDGLNYIDSFFSACLKCEKLLNDFHQNSMHQLNQKAANVQEKLVELAKENQSNIPEYQNKKQEFLGIVTREGYIYSPNYFKLSIIKLLPRINFITSSSYGEKLKEISEKRIWRIL